MKVFKTEIVQHAMQHGHKKMSTVAIFSDIFEGSSPSAPARPVREFSVDAEFPDFFIIFFVINNLIMILF